MWFAYPVRVCWRKIIFFFVCSYQLDKVSSLGMEACVYFPSQLLDPIWLRTVQAMDMLPHSICEFIHMPILLCRRSSFLGAFHPHWLLQSSHLLCRVQWALRGGVWWRCSFKTEDIKISHFLFVSIVGLCIGSYLFQKEASRMLAEKDTDLWVEQNVARSHFITNFFSRIVVLHFLLGLWPN